MSSEMDASQEESANNVQAVEVIGNCDWFLQQTIDSIIHKGVEIGITLSVGGLVVSGTLISGSKYFVELGNLIKRISKEEGDVASVLGESWPKYTAMYELPEGADDSWAPPPAGYIHLREALYYSPGQRPLPSSKGMLWRGRLSSIDAFSIGTLSYD